MKEDIIAYDQELAQRVRMLVSGLAGYEEKSMFGGVGFMLRGNMACGVHRTELIVRVGPKGYEGALAEPNTKPFDMTGRPMRGWVVILAEGYEADLDLKLWVRRGVEFALSLPAK